jgi:hypothetical protein
VHARGVGETDALQGFCGAEKTTSGKCERQRAIRSYGEHARMRILRVRKRSRWIESVIESAPNLTGHQWPQAKPHSLSKRVRLQA